MSRASTHTFISSTKTRVFLLLLSSLLLSFADDSKNELNYLFYNLPLSSSTNAIKNKIRSDSNFTRVDYTRDKLFLRFLSASIAHPHTFGGEADSASIQMNLLSQFLYGNLGKSGRSLKSIELRIFFKDEASQHKEFESIERALSQKFKPNHHLEQIIVASGPLGKDTAIEKGVLFIFAPNKRFPRLTLLQSVTTNKQRYIVLEYLDKNRY